MGRTARNSLRRHSRPAALVAIACLVAGLLVAGLGAFGRAGCASPVGLFADVAYADEASSGGAESSGSSAASSEASASSGDGAQDESSSEESEEKTPETDNLVDPTQRADNSFIYDTTIETLFDEASLYNERVVQVVGEVIGDKIASDDAGSCWITLTSTSEDSPTTISVLMTEEQAGQIDHYGRYGVVGTTFQVRGVYHQACKAHEGLPDIHATNSATITRGVEHHDKLRLRRFIPGAVLVFVGLVLMGIYYFVREKMR